jgi:type I restriction enzyme M protein
MVQGNSLTHDGWADKHFDYMLANPPYGVDWKGYAQPIKDEVERLGFHGRFGAGLPRVSDGSFLFLQHMLSKMKPVDDRPETPWVDGGSKIGIVLSGSPLFAGGAGSGESEIRRWIIENDWLECIVALPDQMFYNTGIFTYVWILTNRKPKERRGKIVLIDARDMGTKMRKSLGDKRKELAPVAIEQVAELFSRANEANDDPRVRVLGNEKFGYARLTIERPLRLRWTVTTEALALVPPSAVAAVSALLGEEWVTAGEAKTALTAAGVDSKSVAACVAVLAVRDPSAPPVTAKKRGAVESDAELRSQESIPLPDNYLDLDEGAREDRLREAAERYLADEVTTYWPDAWVDHAKTRVGYDIPFTKHFFSRRIARPLEEVVRDIQEIDAQIQAWVGGLTT